MSGTEWEWKLREAVERIRLRYAHIGRSTGAPFLAVVYPTGAEGAVLKEWRTLSSTLEGEFEIHVIDVLAATMQVVEDLGSENIVAAIASPMPGSKPEAELGVMWASAVAERVKEVASKPASGKPVIVLEKLAALHPASSPREVMQRLWDSEQSCLSGPVVVLIPGMLVEPRVYSFLGLQEELMYRGDLL